MVDIIVPAYNAHETIEKTLHSICSQLFDKKIKVYICNDASDHDYNEIITKFNKMIDVQEIILKKNSGPAVARQKGIDNSNSKYIVFIDADDVFYSPYSIKKMYDKMEKENLDLLIGDFVEEIDNGEINHTGDTVWLHGKMYKRSFLNDKKISFNKSYSNEDYYFNKSIFMRKPIYGYLNENLYIWCNNKNSITRKNDHEYSFNSIFGFVDNAIQLLNNAIKDEIEYDIIAEYTTCIMLAIYFYYLNYYDWDDFSKILEKSKEIKIIYDKYRVKDIDFDNQLYKNQFNHFCNSSNYLRVIKPKVTLDDFLNLYDI